MAIESARPYRPHSASAATTVEAMITAAIDDTSYRILLLLHILTAFAAFAPAFVHPFLGEQSKALDGTGRATVFGFMVRNGRRIYAPALIVTGLLGFGLPALSKDGDNAVFELSQGWMIAAIVVWLIMNGVLHAVIIPGERAVSEGDTEAESRISAGMGAISLLLVVMLYLMIWKPGL